MAEPWSNDFDALAAQSRRGLRSLDATRAHLSTPQETKMRFFKSHPALAALFVFLALGLVSGAAYAVVHEVWISIDSHESAPQIEQDVRDQLAAQGVAGQVTAEKSGDGKLKVSIMQTGSDGSDVPDLHLEVNGQEADYPKHGLRIETRADLDAAQQQRLTDAASSPEMVALLEACGSGSGAGSDGDRAAAIAKVLADHGFHDAQVQVTGGSVQVTITAPPSP